MRRQGVQGVQGVQDVCLSTQNPTICEEIREFGIVLNSLRSTLVALLAENSLNSLSTKSKRSLRKSN
ncbi:MAG: hypothetical protein J6Y33_08050, partial [Prevotella sp.]|nr:hypothetical protein [Prevotella sp.]